jgi:hypothetical protein
VFQCPASNPPPSGYFGSFLIRFAYAVSIYTLTWAQTYYHVLFS